MRQACQVSASSSLITSCVLFDRLLFEDKVCDIVTLECHRTRLGKGLLIFPRFPIKCILCQGVAAYLLPLHVVA